MSELGLALKEARETMDLSLDDLQEKTKIQKRYLLAIEEGEFDRLPGHFYTRAFIKSYAETVGLDPNEIFETYRSEVPRTGSDLETLPPRNSRETIRSSSSGNVMKNVQYVIIVVIVLIVAVVIWFLAQHFVSGKNASTPQNQNNGATFKNAKDLGNGPKSGGSSTTNNSIPPSANSKASSSGSSNTNAANLSSGTTPGQGTTPPVAEQQIKLTSSQGNSYTYNLSGTKKFVLDISALKGKNSWVEVHDTNLNGKRYFYGNVTDYSGSTPVSFHQDLSSLKQVYVKVGDVQTATIKINGQKLNVPSTPVFQQITIVYKP